MKTREIEIMAEFPFGERFKPVGISIERGFVLRKLDGVEEDTNERVSFGSIALIIIENGKESYLKFK